MQKMGKGEVVQPGETKDVRIDFRIPDVMPSTNGKFIVSKYLIDVLTEVAMAPDIECHFPLTVFMPGNEYKVGDVSEYIVAAGPCAVEALPYEDGTVVEPVPVAQVTLAQEDRVEVPMEEVVPYLEEYDGPHEAPPDFGDGPPGFGCGPPGVEGTMEAAGSMEAAARSLEAAARSMEAAAGRERAVETAEGP